MQVDKALDVLEAFLKNQGELGIAELAKLTKLNVSTAHRIASILVKRGYLTQSKKRAKYFLGPRLLEFSPIIVSGMTIRDIARPFLEKLNQAVNESVNLAILDTDAALIVDYIQSSKSLRYVNRIGERIPLHSTGLGKALLAHTVAQNIENFLKNNRLPAYTKNTITDPDRLKQELDTIRSEGIAVDHEENELGGRCIAAPIMGTSGKLLAAVSISAPAPRLDSSRIESLKLMVKDISRQISRAVGHGNE